MLPATRTEHDLLGSRVILRDVRYGIHTVRAAENFPSIGRRVADVPEFCRAFGMVKLAALRANVECGVVVAPVAEALEQACGELANDEAGLRGSLVLPLLQGGAGTSTNMNVNETLANRALELLSEAAGHYDVCHPNDHVNRSQSTNDVYPTALRVALVLRQAEVVEPALELLLGSLRRASERFAGVAKLGRTQLQDAVPMTVDQEIGAWFDGIDNAARTLASAADGLLTINLGGTAIGTGLAAPTNFGERAVAHLREVSGLQIRSADRLVSATTDPSALLAASSALRGGALVLAKVANDLRLLSSGPRAGLAEYRLPPLQAGSSMMPGKINPVIPEYVNQLAFRIRGLDATATMALDAGQLQLNAMLPAVAEALFEAQELLACGARAMARSCIEGLDVDEQRMGATVGDGLGEMTELAAVAGYRAAAELTARARRSGVAPDGLAREAAARLGSTGDAA
jgi:aspartate ammonia-lyase